MRSDNALNRPTAGWLRPTAVLTLAIFWSTIDRAVALPMIPTIAADFHADAAVASWAITGHALAYAVFQLVWGPLQSRWGRTRVLWVSAAIGTVAAVASALAPTLPFFIVARIASVHRAELSLEPQPLGGLSARVRFPAPRG